MPGRSLSPRRGGWAAHRIDSDSSTAPSQTGLKGLWGSRRRVWTLDFISSHLCWPRGPKAALWLSGGSEQRLRRGTQAGDTSHHYRTHPNTLGHIPTCQKNMSWHRRGRTTGEDQNPDTPASGDIERRSEAQDAFRGRGQVCSSEPGLLS